MRLKSCFWDFRHTSLLLVVLFCFSLLPSVVRANTNLSISPLIIDRTTENRDIITENITLTNRSSRPLRIYATVNGISLSGAGEIESFVSPAMSDRTTSLTSWIEISRARLEIPAESSIQVPLTIRINPNAEPGSYHAFIGFASGHNRDVAEEIVLRGGSQGVIVRVSINEKRNEQLQLIGYTTSRFAAFGGKQSVKFTLRNNGGVPLMPDGEIIIYDSRGREVGAVDVALSTSVISPGEEYEFTADLPPTPGLGRHKAYLTVDYGARRAAVHDTTFFVSIPWFLIFILIGSILLILLSIVMITRSRGVVAYNSDNVNEVGFLVRPRKSHTSYDHDINLKNHNK
jgi:hypothetical protein